MCIRDRSNEDCSVHNSSQDSGGDGNILKFDTSKTEMNLWTRIFRFDDEGIVYFGNSSTGVGKVNNPF